MRHTETSPNDREALFGRWLKKRRKSLGLTQKTLAARAEYSVAMLRKIEAEERRPSLELASRLAEILDIAKDEQEAFIKFARGGWSDLPPQATLPMLERPWLQQSGIPPVPHEPAIDRAALSTQPELLARKAELKRLETHLAQALAGHTQVVLVRGEAGQGKTALLQYFAHATKTDHPELLLASGSCNAYTGPGDPYLPFREILQLLANDPTTVAAIAEMGPDLIGTFIPEQLLLTMFATHGLTGSAHARSIDAAAARRAGMHVPLQSAALMAQYLAVISTLARKRPLLLLLDDLHWIDTASTDLLLHLTKHLAGSKVLLLGAYRGIEVAHGRSEARHPLAAVTNELRREHGDAILDLDRGSDREFVDDWLDQEPNHLDGDFRDALLQQTGGHPLFTIELVRAMQERGDLVRDETDHWIAPPQMSWKLLPARIEGVIDERLGRLAPALTEWLKVAAVEGEEFTAEVIALVLDTQVREITRGLSTDLSGTHRLITAHSVQRLHGVSIAHYRFRHNLIQRRMYESLDTVERAYLHEAVAEALAILHASRLDEVAVQLAHHFLAAGAPGRAAVHLREAGRNASRAGALDEAIRYFTAALEHWPDSDMNSARAPSPSVKAPVDHGVKDNTTRERAEIEQKLGECHWLSGHRVEAQASLERAYERYESIGDAEGAAAVQRRMGRVYWEMGMRPRSLEHYRKSLEILKDQPETRELARTLSSISQMHMLASEYDLAVSVGQRALELARRLDAKDAIAHALNNIGTALMSGWTGRFDEGRANLLESKELALELGLPHDACRAMFNLGEHLRAHGRTNEARTVLHELLPYADRLGISIFTRAGRYELFDLERRCGRWRDAFTNPAWTEQSNTGPIPADHAGALASIYFATAHTDLGAPDVALALLDGIGDAVTTKGESQFVLPYLGERIRALASLGRRDEGDQHVDRLLQALATVPFTEHGARRGLLAACQWLGTRGKQQGERLAACVNELHRLERQFNSPNMTAAARESEGWLALLTGHSTQAAERFEDADRQWLHLGFPLDRLRALDGNREALLRSGRATEAKRAFDAADQILLSLAAQLEQSDLAERMARVRRKRLDNNE